MDKISPEIRFRGFSTKWKQKKLGEIANIIDPHPSHRAPEETKEGVPFIGIGDVAVDGTINNHNVRIVDEKEYEEHHRRYDLAIPSLGIGRVASLGKVIRLRNDIGKYTVSPTLSIMQFNSSSDLDFLFCAMSSPLFQKQFTSLSNGSTRQSVGIQDLRAIEISISSDEDEQKEIGSFFKYIDNLISLETCELDKLKIFKKACLEKMFPKEGETVPELRFEGFTDAWEQRKLGELCSITTGKLDANAMVLDGRYDFYTSGIDVFKIDKAAFEGPAITIAGNGASVGYMHLADGKFNAYQRTYVLTDFSADRQFLNVAIGNKLPYKIQEEVRGSGIPYIVLNMLTDLVIPFPSQKEQATIGAYFAGLDNLITLHQRKLDKLKSLKQACLEKMFI